MRIFQKIFWRFFIIIKSLWNTIELKDFSNVKQFGGFFKIFWEIFMLLIYTMTIFPNVHYINTTIFCSYTLSQYFLMSTLYVTICYSYTLYTITVFPNVHYIYNYRLLIIYTMTIFPIVHSIHNYIFLINIITIFPNVHIYILYYNILQCTFYI